MKKYLPILLVLIFAIPALAQRPNVKPKVIEAMKRISVMGGTWEGSGWRMSPSGERETSNVHEELTFKLDGTLLFIEGIGKDDNGTILHNAVGIISYNPFTEKYVFNAYLSDGLSTVANFEVVKDNEVFKWWFDDNRGGTIRYSVDFANDQWKEIGEYSADGENWRQFFEMTLKKVE